MNDTSEQARLQAKKKQLKLLMIMMLVFVVAGPLLGPKIFAKEFAGLSGAGLYFFYIATPTVFAGLFFLYLFVSGKRGACERQFRRTPQLAQPNRV